MKVFINFFSSSNDFDKLLWRVSKDPISFENMKLCLTVIYFLAINAGAVLIKTSFTELYFLFVSLASLHLSLNSFLSEVCMTEVNYVKEFMRGVISKLNIRLSKRL